jgi:ABC-type uncharacterized transport system permease subunit
MKSNINVWFFMAIVTLIASFWYPPVIFAAMFFYVMSHIYSIENNQREIFDLLYINMRLTKIAVQASDYSATRLSKLEFEEESDKDTKPSN